MQPAQELLEKDRAYCERINQEIEILFAAINGVNCYLQEIDDVVCRHLSAGLYSQFWRLREILEPLIGEARGKQL